MMMNGLFQWLLIGAIGFTHPLYVSVVDIQHNKNEKLVEVSVRIFTDDLEKTLRKTNSKVDLTAGDRATNDKLITNYLTNTLHLKVNGQDGVMQYLGYEQQQESTWCYFEIHNIAAVKQIDVSCKILYDFQPGQMNIIHTKVNGVEKSYKLDNPKSTTSFDF